MTTTPKIDINLMTADELLALPRGNGKRYELIRGVLIEKTPAGKSQGVAGSRINYALAHHAEANGYEITLSPDTGYLLDRDPDTVRAPSVAWFAPGRLPEPDGFPNLAVEVKSPGNS